jgi:hypothetical protein
MAMRHGILPADAQKCVKHAEISGEMSNEK